MTSQMRWAGGERAVPAPDAREPRSHEEERLRRLALYRILHTPSEPEFDSIARLAADLLAAPIAFLSLTGEKSHWFKARIGFDLDEVQRSTSFCDHTLRERDVMVVEDASRDPRFADS